MEQIQNDIMTGEPVSGFPMKFTWQTGDWVLLFDKQIELIKQDIKRAKVQDKMIIYLSCPISSRGGGYSVTNVEIAEYTKTRLYKELGTGFWILNPASYQMESKAGTGLMHGHAIELWGSDGEKRLEELYKKSPPIGGDYMRMWTNVLVKDNNQNVGGDFDMFYFLGPDDVRNFFFNEGGNTSLSGAIYGYFSRKFNFDSDFNKAFTTINYTDWENLRKDFFKFYSTKASVSFSLGSHDEWNILVKINELRMKYNQIPSPNADISSQIDVSSILPGFFNGVQLQPGALFKEIPKGYEDHKPQ